MLERLLLTVIMLAIGVGIYLWYRQRQLARVASRPDDPLLQDLRLGTPAIVYFTTPGCVPCKVVQRPAIAKLTEQLGDGVQVIEIDASTRPDDAARWGVFTAPTTFILDRSLKPRTVNHGVADARKLMSQLEAV